MSFRVEFSGADASVLCEMRVPPGLHARVFESTRPPGRKAGMVWRRWWSAESERDVVQADWQSCTWIAAGAGGSLPREGRTGMSAEDITRISLEELIRRKDEDRTDWERLRREAEQGDRAGGGSRRGRIRLVSGPGGNAGVENGRVHAAGR